MEHAEKECFAIIRAKVEAFGNNGWLEIELNGKIVRVPLSDVRELQFINASE
jgi:hypothetical protein